MWKVEASFIIVHTETIDSPCFTMDLLYSITQEVLKIIPCSFTCEQQHKKEWMVLRIICFIGDLPHTKKFGRINLFNCLEETRGKFMEKSLWLQRTYKKLWKIFWVCSKVEWPNTSVWEICSEKCQHGYCYWYWYCDEHNEKLKYLKYTWGSRQTMLSNRIKLR